MILQFMKIWLMAARPKTLSAALAPVIIGTAMAYEAGGLHILSAILCLLAAICIQIGTNFSNDYFDFIKGIDTIARTGPLRATQAGLVSPKQMRNAFCLTFMIAALISIYLILRGGWPILIIGILSIVSGILYTAGPKPLGYIGLGDIFVLIFFGPVAVGGTYYCQTLHISFSVIAAGFSTGFISVALLCVNNIRDLENDRHGSKRTLAVRFGRTFARFEYLTAIFLSAFIPPYIFLWSRTHKPILICMFSFIISIPSIYSIFTKIDGPSLNKTLADTGKILLIHSLLFAFGWIL
ncbi:MAG: 1,4-dihydroxy-2-naphthoate polyprenyltransferase [Chlamydiota bacterium]|nr:1,4-dihydroxy-2-naphthoate polyprenyltransferase [Chlamydiota bacterium]